MGARKMASRIKDFSNINIDPVEVSTATHNVGGVFQQSHLQKVYRNGS